MAGQPFSLANLLDTAEALYGRQWQAAMARDLKVSQWSIVSWCAGDRLPDLRWQLADICRWYAGDDRTMAKIARKLEKLGPPERLVQRRLNGAPM